MRSRTVHGAGVDDPLAWYSGGAMDTTTLRFLHADRQGSIALLGDAGGNAVRIWAYDEWGAPMASGGFGDGAGGLLPDNGARHLYTGQAWLPGMGLYYYKARIYSPTLGRFLQTDPIGYDDQMNLYAYVGGDPMNGFDPTGLQGRTGSTSDPDDACSHDPTQCIVVNGRRPPDYIVDENIDVNVDPLTPVDLDDLIGSGGGGGSDEPQSKPCPVPTSVELAGTLNIYGAGAAFAGFDGTLTDKASGRSFSFSTQIGVGGGFGAGRFSVTGTVPSFSSLDQGFSLQFALAGYKAFEGSVAKLHPLGRPSESIGNIDVDAFILSLPGAAADFGFKNGAMRKLKSPGRGC